jgi:Holliday junction DNA helicase RuvB
MIHKFILRVTTMPRPLPKFRNFIGQTPIVDYLRRQLDGAQARHEPFPHALFLGPSGVGKTLLSLALAAEFGTKLIEARGYEDRAALAQKLAAMAAHDFFFIDECQRLRPLEQEMLCEAIDRDSIPTPERQRPGQGAAEQERTPLKPWTLVLATDQPGLLLDALSKRIVVEVPLSYYTAAEMKEIIEAMATEAGILISPHAARLIADVAGGLPRRANQLLQNLRFFHPNAEGRQLGLPDIRSFLDAAGVDAAGLNRSERRYMEVVTELGGASLESIALALGTDVDFLRRRVEPNLVRRRLVKISSVGRQLTPLGQELERDSIGTADAASSEKGGRA